MKLLAVFSSLFVAALAASSAQAADPGTAQVYQQRTSDGRILLTDRPLDGARTERTWKMEREDPAAARARSDRVQKEADAVSERIDRRIAADELRLARQDLEAERQASTHQEDQPVVYPGGYAYPGNWGHAGRHGRRGMDGSHSDRPTQHTFNGHRPPLPQPPIRIPIAPL